MSRLIAIPFLSLAILWGSIGISNGGDFESGFVAYKNGDYATALRKWRPLAEQGDAKSQFQVGWMYEKGQGVSQNFETAVNWYRLAAIKRHAPAQFNLGVMYNDGTGVPQNYAIAAKWYRLAAEQGDEPAQKKLGFICLEY